jgi:hypothetical protein
VRIAANSRFETAAEVAEHMAKLARDPQLKIVTGTGQGFIFGMPGGIPPKPTNASQQMDKNVDKGGDATQK